MTQLTYPISYNTISKKRVEAKILRGNESGPQMPAFIFNWRASPTSLWHSMARGVILHFFFKWPIGLSVLWRGHCVDRLDVRDVTLLGIKYIVLVF